MNSDEKWLGPLFIVGASRSGTAMLRSILNKSQEVNLASETHYFDDLRPRVINKPVSEMSEEEKKSCTDYFRSQTVRPYGANGDPAQSSLNPAELLAKAAAMGDSVDDIFEAYCRMRIAGNKPHIWGEKTPRHVFRIDDIFSVFPNARIICMVRDPRAVAASYRDWNHMGGLPSENNPDYQAALLKDDARKHASYHIVIASMMWRAAANAAFKAAKKYTNKSVRIVRYEDVVDNPEQTTRDLSSWLGIAFDDAMLDIPLHNSSTIKFAKEAGVSKAPQKRWRKVLSENEVGVIQKVSGKSLEEAGYEKISTGPGVFSLIGAYITVPFAVVRAARANRSRYNSLSKYIFRRLKAVLR